MNALPRRAHQALSLIEDGMMVASMAAVTVLITIQIILRYVFNDSLSWVEEFVRYTVVWMSLIGAGLGIRARSHIAVEILQTALGPKAGRWLALFAWSLGLVFAALLFVYGGQLALHTLTFGQLSSAMRVPMGAVYACLPLGSAFLSIRLIQAMVLTARSGTTSQHKQDDDVAWTGGL